MATHPHPPTGRAAIVLAGGRSRRMGSDKAALLLDGRPLLAHVVEAAGAHGPVVLVAPERRAAATLDDAALAHLQTVALEDPPDGGPAAGICAGLAALPDDTRDVLVLACDLPAASRLAAALTAAQRTADVLAPVDDEGFVQHLAARYSVAALRAAASALGTTRDISVRRLVGGLTVQRLDVDPAALVDVDDPLAAARHGLTHP